MPETTKRLLLPHEPVLIRLKIAELAKVQEAHGQLLGEAMNQGAETFHDNAPAESVRDDQEILVKRARPLLAILAAHDLIDYPDFSSDAVHIGTRAEVRVDKAASFLIDIVGFRPVAVSPKGVEVVSYDAPMAKALLGRKVGELFQATWSGNLESGEIVSVDQTAIRNASQSLVE